MKYFEYKQKVHKSLRDMKCQTVSVDFLIGKKLLPSEKTKPYFIKAVKDFIDNHDNKKFVIEFSNDYKKFRKYEVF